jgi:hypothetical protein
VGRANKARNTTVKKASDDSDVITEVEKGENTGEEGEGKLNYIILGLSLLLIPSLAVVTAILY